jgi:hypothetical protein
MDNTINKPPILAAAQYWANKGFPVFPLRHHLKTPANADGFRSASTDQRQVLEWFGGGSQHNIGLKCGGGLVVIDVDVKGGVNGMETLHALESAHGVLPSTFEVATPSGGKHLYYRYPAGVQVGSRAGKIAGNPAPGVDVRGDGGYVVVPPSTLHADADPKGKAVTGEYLITKKVAIADLPTTWLSVLEKQATQEPPQQHKPRHEPRAESDKLADIQDALAHVPPDNYDTWARMGMALYSLGNDGFALWDAWSRNSAKYYAKEMPAKWRSFEGSQINPQSVFFEAAQHGWVNPARGRPRNQEGGQQQQHRTEWRGNHANDDQRDHVRLVSGLSITPRRMEWVWKDWLPRGKLSLLVGAPKTGKTLLAIDLAAVITSGGTFPDGTRADKSDVIFWTAEDDLDDTISPRFKAAGGDLSRVHFVGNTVSSGRGQPFNPAQDLPLLMGAIQGMEKPPALLILDPVVSVTHDMNNALQVRMSLLPVIEMAQAHGMAVCGITHFRKSSGEAGNIGERIIGSSAFLQVARMVWYAIKPPDMDGQRVFFKGDTNLAESDEGYLYEVEGREAEFKEHQLTIQTAGIVWGEKLQGDALQAFIKPDAKADTAPVQAEAEAFLKQFLASGARLKKDIEEEAENRAITKITLGRAKRELGIKHRKRRGDGKYEWYFKEADEHVYQAHTHDIGDKHDTHDKHSELVGNYPGGVEVFEV